MVFLDLANIKNDNQNCIIIDWLTFSCAMSFDDLKKLLGLDSRDWKLEKGSRLFYAERWSCGSISIHTTPKEKQNTEKKFNIGSCVEMSGQGCREYESFGLGDWTFLLCFIYKSCIDPELNFNISRLDLAYDDFIGVLDIQKIALQAWNLDFTSKLSRVSVISDMSKQDESVRGITITHGSKSSNTFMRIYDKRVEKNRLDLDHWIRWEIQLRGLSAFGALSAAFEKSDNVSLGSFFGGIVLQYVQYRDKALDSNKARWELSQWYLDFIGTLEKISIWSKKDVEYNKERMDRYAYRQNHNHTLTMIQADGILHYLHELWSAAQGEDYPQKYKDVLAKFCGSRGRAALHQGLPADFFVWVDQLKQQLALPPDPEDVSCLRSALHEAFDNADVY